MTQVGKVWASMGLAAAVLIASPSTQASEVVKLARLVVGGKRTAAEPPRTTPPEPRSSSGNPQAHGTGGGSTDDTGTAPAPSRGIS